MQKTWLWIFGAMVIFPEVLFWFTPLSIISIFNNFSGPNIEPLIYWLFGAQFFASNTFSLFLVLAIEWIGVAGLLIISIKINKKIIAIFLGIFLVWLSVIFALAYAISSMGF